MTCYCHFRKQIYSKKAHLLSTVGDQLAPHVLQEQMHMKTAVYCNYSHIVSMYVLLLTRNALHLSA